MRNPCSLPLLWAAMIGLIILNLLFVIPGFDDRNPVNSCQALIVHASVFVLRYFFLRH
jgi:hypothetical protein